MKKLILFFVGFFIVVTLFGQDKVIIRLDKPLPEDVKYFSTNNYDIASVRPGEYLDLVVTTSEFQNLVSQGYNFRIYQTIAEMAANLQPEKGIPGYRTYAQALAELQQIENTYPDICKLYNIGETRGKQYYNAGNNNYVNYQHDIWALKVSDNVELDEDEPAIYYMGLHHAREPLSTEVTFYVLNHLLQNYGVDPEITEAINSKEIWFIPIVNPDGHRIVIEQINTDWRKNIRDNDGNGQITNGSFYYPDGVDLNRNYSWHWGEEGTSTNPSDITYCGPEPFSEPELIGIRDLLAARHFVAGISYHTYSELVLWPYGYTSNAVAPDATALAALGTAMGNAIPKLGSGTYTPQPIWALYPASGGTDDYAYGKHGIFCYTIELATQFIPPASQVIQVCQDNLQAALILLNRVNKSTLTGHVTNSVTGEPVVAEVYIQGIDNTGLYREPYKSNEAFGTYYRMLPNGNYTITFSAFGYISQTFNNVNINNLNQTILDMQLVPAQVVTVTGTVIDADTGLPIENATIQVMGTPLEPIHTNASGQYIIPEIYENTYTFRVYAMDYLTVSQEIAINPQNNIVDFELHEAHAVSFEDGQFPEGWTFSGNLPWIIDNTTAWDGAYSARSGAIGNSQTSSLIYTMETDTEGVISFYCKVSSEANYDFLRFYINDELQAQWSGNMDWAEVSFPVTPGVKTFRWTYSKDVSASGGSDKAWIDFIILPFPAAYSAPKNLTATVVTANSAQLNWLPGGDETIWDVSWGPAGTTPSQGTIIENLTSTQYQLTGLTPITEYVFYVRGSYPDNQMSAWAGPAPFTTLCDVFSLPYFEPFGTPLVSCWTFPEGQGNWNFGSSYTPPSGSAPNAFFGWSPSITNYSYSLVSPLFSAVGFSDIKLDFKLYINNFSTSTVEQMAVEYKTIGSNDWILLENFTNSGGTAQFNRTNQLLDGMAGQHFQVRFRAHGANSYNINGWGLDDINFHGEALPSVVPGDANCDGIVNILDAIAIVDFIAGNDPHPFCFENADVTEDGIINILDVIGTVNIILNGKKSSGYEFNSATANIYLGSSGIELESDGTLAGLQFEISGLSIEIPEFLLKGYEFVTAIKDDKLIGMIFSFDNTPIPAGRINLLSFNNESHSVELGSVIAGNLNAEEVRVIKHFTEGKDLFSGEFQLNAHPNPSNGVTNISIIVPISSWVSIKIYDMHGKVVSIITEKSYDKGIYNFVANEGRIFKSGIYTIQLIACPLDTMEDVIHKNIKLLIN
ncbi:MAG: T9SS type A sorting domain-containing protein [Bacteroidales bacterium]|jgi:hypothetical protein|nr:T9SS type A sorting domain-containing protein [Bacteroidales bacterium]